MRLTDMRGRAWRAATVPLLLLASLVLATSAHAQSAPSGHHHTRHVVVLAAVSVSTTHHSRATPRPADLHGVGAQAPLAAAAARFIGYTATASRSTSALTAHTILVRGPPANAV